MTKRASSDITQLFRSAGITARRALVVLPLGLAACGMQFEQATVRVAGSDTPVPTNVVVQTQRTAGLGSTQVCIAQPQRDGTILTPQGTVEIGACSTTTGPLAGATNTVLNAAAVGTAGYYYIQAGRALAGGNAGGSANGAVGAAAVTITRDGVSVLTQSGPGRPASGGLQTNTTTITGGINNSNVGIRQGNIVTPWP